MPLLDRNGAAVDRYVRVGLEDLARESHALVAWADAAGALARRARDQTIGVEVDNAIRAAELQLVQRQLSLIAIHFPSFADGRGFSLAKQLRNAGYSGTLRAVGPLIADQFAYALACGFDEVELSEEVAARQPVGQWLEALASITRGYQRGYGDAGNILDRRRVARGRAS
jgi:uncharacterized protein (DUF934 family)